ncbi:MAG TPA: lipopolysaccharide heptosyltransferase 1, partial [Gammaproteobacteria bacterium]|nr:lipopolysaccharide heptosyltransferase 1 [Gammaproteobacteria bacterium]
YDKNEIDYGLDTSRIDGSDEPVKHKQVVFLHGTTWATKHWPEYYWRHLAHIATENGFKVLLPWGDQSEKQRADFIAKDNQQVEVLDRLPL